VSVVTAKGPFLLNVELVDELGVQRRRGVVQQGVPDTVLVGRFKGVIDREQGWVTMPRATVFELAGAVRQYPNGATLYGGNGSEVMARAGWCRMISARRARAVHTSAAAI